MKINKAGYIAHYVATVIMIILTVSILQTRVISLERRVTALQLRNSELGAFERNQRNVDNAQDERINELIRSIYPEKE